MFLYVFILYVFLFFSFMLYLINKAPSGYENNTGFHMDENNVENQSHKTAFVFPKKVENLV